MPTTVVNELGRVGLVKDRKPVELPPNAWTDLQNVRCVDGAIKPFGGSRSVATLEVQPWSLARITIAGQDYLYYLGQGELYYLQGDGTSVEVTGASNIGAAPASAQELTEFGNVLIANGSQSPQYTDSQSTKAWLPFDSTDEADTCTWKDIGMEAAMIRSFKNYLIALDVTDCGTRNQQRVWWSHPAVFGTVPITWDVSKVEYDAGYYDLKQTQGVIVDAIPLRDAFFIFGTDFIVSMTYAGSSYIGDVSSIWNFRYVTTDKGLFSKRCVCDIGGALFFISDQEFYVFDGTNFTPIADERVKKYFFQNAAKDNKDRAFVVYNERFNEVWVVWPESGDSWATKALVWNIRDNAWSDRNVSSPICALSSPVTLPTSAGTTWGDLAGTTWGDLAGSTWASLGDTSQDAGEYLLMGLQNKKLMQFDIGTQDDGVDIVCYAQRTHLDIGDKEDWHMVKRIRPYASGADVQVRVGTHDNLTGAATWSDRQTFDPDTEYKLDFRETGRLYAIEFYWPAGGDSEVSGYEIDFEPAGRR